MGSEGSFGSLPPGTALDDGEKRAKRTPNASFQKLCEPGRLLQSWDVVLVAVGLQPTAWPWCSQ